jgi:hypothetical protein
MKKALLIIMLILLLPSVYAVTKPTRGFVQFSDGTSAYAASVTVEVTVHSNLDKAYQCTCDTPAVKTVAKGEFVQDLGNLRYKEDCSFWSKSKGGYCGNDWAKEDTIRVHIQTDSITFDTTEGIIGLLPIYEFGTITLPSPSSPSQQTTTSSIPSSPGGLSGSSSGGGGTFLPSPSALPKILSPKKDVGITSILLYYSEKQQEFNILAKVSNGKSFGINNLKLKFIVKDISGQEIKSFFSKTFSVGAGNKKQVKTTANLANLTQGVVLLNALLFDGEKLIAASDTVQAFLYKSGEEASAIILQQVESNRAMWPIWLFLALIAIILVILIFQIIIMRKEVKIGVKKRGRRYVKKRNS